MEPKEIWQARWKSIEDTLKDLAGEYTHHLELRGMLTLQSLTWHLLVFGKSHFNFFLDNMLKLPASRLKGADPAEPESDPEFCGYTAEHALNTILAQVGYDMEVIRAAADQRINGPENLRLLLNKADWLAYQAIQPAVKKEWLTNSPVVICYVQKQNAVRVIPYANVMLVGLPITCVNAERDFLATAHEVGHFVYWRGRINQTDYLGKTIRDAVQKQFHPQTSRPKGMVQQWVEEIFADIYGAAIGGPVMALDFQDIADRESEKHFIKDDKDHPIPALRPQIYAEVWRKQSPNDDRLANKMDKHWKGRVSRRKLKRTLIFHNDEEIATVNVGDVEDRLREAVNAIWDNVGPLKTWIETITDQLPPNEISDWYQTFEDYVAGLTPTPDQLKQIGELSKILNEDELANLWVDWVKAENFFEGNQPPPPGDIPAGLPEQPGGWLRVLVAQGWTVEGPNSQWKPPGM